MFFFTLFYVAMTLIPILYKTVPQRKASKKKTLVELEAL